MHSRGELNARRPSWHFCEPSLALHIINRHLSLFCSDPSYCAFSYKVALTPNISSITPNAGTIGDTITITGQGFSSTPANNTVLVGGVKAKVVSSSGGQIQATLASGGVAGWTRVVVVVDGKGYAAELVANVTSFRLRNLQLNRFWPPTISTLGGSLVTLSGSGFDPLNFSRNTITVCGSACQVVNLTTSSESLTCIAPAANASASPCSVSVSVDLGSGQSDSVTLSGISYANTGAPHIESVSPARVSAGSGGLILIQGRDFSGLSGQRKLLESSAAPTVKLRELSSGSEAECTVGSVSSTEMTCQAEGASAGLYRVLVTLGENVTAISMGTVEVALGEG